jgi:hypothetical protein
VRVAEIQSEDGRYRLAVQADGNSVVYDRGRPVWDRFSYEAGQDPPIAAPGGGGGGVTLMPEPTATRAAFDATVEAAIGTIRTRAAALRVQVGATMTRTEALDTLAEDARAAFEAGAEHG